MHRSFPRTDCRSVPLFRWLPVILALAALVCPGAAHGQRPADDFRQFCKGCHTIGGGPMFGPDLKDVTARQTDREWLADFILNPKSKLDNPADEYAQKLLQAHPNKVMPPAPPDMTRQRVMWLIEFIEQESKNPSSEFAKAGAALPDRPFTPEDVARGREYFLGLQRLANGGAACISCHSVNNLSGLGGGQLGPDLTDVCPRQGGRRNLAGWLRAPATPTMLPIYKQRPLTDEEVLALTAYLEDASKNGTARESTAQINFFLFGLGGAAAALVAFGGIWNHRFRAVRRPLVAASAEKFNGSAPGKPKVPVH